MLQQLRGDRLGSHGDWRAATKHLEHRRVGSDDPVLLPSAYSNRKRRDRVTSVCVYLYNSYFNRSNMSLELCIIYVSSVISSRNGGGGERGGWGKCERREDRVGALTCNSDPKVLAATRG